ncbi:MAG: tRNA pseudouridine(55) synthase TruB [Bacilli bacterium]|nr:tRNA pseudouridine(55) synthase TruB [Bacilli bacterium]
MNGGLLLIDKPSGVTSRYVDNFFQRRFHNRKVGHLGTLDPFATGLLIVAVGEATKYLPFLPDEEKTYQATLHLGVHTTTGDLTGEVDETQDVPELTKEKMVDALNHFLGASKQLPPMTSAIKKDGVPLYKISRKGEEVERESRDIYVHAISLDEFNGSEIVFTCTVSKGTYIRVLGEDIAKALGTVGHLTALRRLKVGETDVTSAISIDNADSKDLLHPARFIAYPRLEVTGIMEKQVRNGVKLHLESDAGRILMCHEGEALAIYEKEGDIYRCLRGL